MSKPAAKPSSPSPKELQEEALRCFGKRLQQERERQGLSMRQLALDTRVSTAVLEALEKGWLQRLPEAAFLGTILHKLAERLSLPGAEIDQEIKAALPPLYKSNKQASDRITGFTLGSIELFSTWQGTIAYGAMVLVLIYGLNLQQRQLASANGISIAPISPNPTLKKPETPTKQLLKLYPELRPLP